jgi:hypothetical protein
MSLPTEESFLKDVAHHEMTVKHDDGLYRHLRFQKPGSWCMGFDIVTWPGYLSYSGNMGSYLFARIPDMLEFFRLKDGDCISHRYWAEKVHAVDRCDGIKLYSSDRFVEAAEDWMKVNEWPDDAREAARDDVISRAHDGEHEAMRAAMDFRHGRWWFEDFYEVSVREYSYRFLWCCYALPWAVRKYDESKVRD